MDDFGKLMTLGFVVAVVFIMSCPVLLGFAGYLLVRRAPVRYRRVVLRLAAANIVLCLIDLLLLLLLPLLDLSFGPVGVPLVAWWGMRYFLLVSWAGLARRHAAQADFERQVYPSIVINLVLNGALIALLVYSFYIEPFQVGVTTLDLRSQVRVSSPHSVRPVEVKGGAPVRIVQLADVHVDRTNRYEQDLPLRVAELKPDVILLTGDYLNLSNLQDPVSMQHARSLLAQLHAPLGVYAVMGSIDSPSIMAELINELEITLLDNEITRLPLAGREVYLVGVTLDWRDRDAETLKRLMARIPPGAESILLYHTPDLIDTASQLGVDLYLAGHTHGGQIRLPFFGAMVTMSYFGKQYEMGYYRVKDTHLYVSRGIGMEGKLAPRARFLCPPEIVVIDD